MYVSESDVRLKSKKKDLEGDDAFFEQSVNITPVTLKFGANWWLLAINSIIKILMI